MKTGALARKSVIVKLAIIVSCIVLYVISPFSLLIVLLLACFATLIYIIYIFSLMLRFLNGIEEEGLSNYLDGDQQGGDSYVRSK